MMRILYSILSIAVLSQTVLADTPGIACSIDLSVLDEAKNTYFTYIRKAISGFKITNYDFDNGHVYSNTFNVKNQQANGIDILPSSDNSIEIQILRMDSYFKSSDFQYKLWFVPVNGELTVNMSDVSIKTILEFTTTKVNGRNLFAFKAKSTDVTINTDNLAFDLSGGFLAKIADAFVPVFKKLIKNEVELQIETKMNTELPKVLNDLMQKDKGYYNISKAEKYKNLTLDYSVETTGSCVDNYVQVGLNGTVFNSGKGYFVPNTTQINMPFRNNKSSSKFQVFLSNYFFDTLAYSYLQDGNFTFTVKSSEVPSTFMISMTTTGLNSFFNGLTSFFGENIPIDIGFKIHKAYAFDSSAGKNMASAKIILHLALYVNYQNGTVIEAGTFEFPDMDLDYAIKLNGFSASAEINKVSIQEAYLASEYISTGKQDLTILKTFFNAAFSFGIVYFNLYLQNFVYKIPQILLSQFYLTDLSLAYFDQYIQVGATPTFLPVSSGNTLNEDENAFEETTIFGFEDLIEFLQ